MSGPLISTREILNMFNLPNSIPKRIALLVLAAFFIVAGGNHFANLDFYLSIMPPYLPAHIELVYISGIFEMLGGLGILASATRKWAGYGLIALLVAVFPANIYMAMDPERFADLAARWALYIRLPLQFVLMMWVYWATKE